MSRSRLLLAVSALFATGFTLIAVAHAPARRLASTHDHAGHRHVLGGVDPTPVAVGGRAAIEAAFPFESYRPGETARLRLWTRLPAGASLQVFHIGRKRYYGAIAARRDAWDAGDACPPHFLAASGPDDRASHRRLAERPVLRSAHIAGPNRLRTFRRGAERLGENRAAVVLPTRTWQAYNMRDDDGDGRGGQLVRDSRSTTTFGWAGRFRTEASRPTFSSYDLGFLHWLHDTGRGVDVLAQEDLDETTGAELAAAYDLLVFPGHHEYVTEAEYDAVTGFRDRGGNLMFLSANNFFWRIDVQAGVMTRVAQWRNARPPRGAPAGRPVHRQRPGREPARLGAYGRRHRTGSSRASSSAAGGAFSKGGIEIDAVAPSSPAWHPDRGGDPEPLRPGQVGAHDVLRDEEGPRVFSAGAFTLAGAIRQPAVRTLLTNLWERLARTVASPSGLRPMTPQQNRRPAPPRRPARASRTCCPSTLRSSSRARWSVPRQRVSSPRWSARRKAWQDPAAAARDGFDVRRPARDPGEDRVMWFHSEQRRNRRDDAYFDPKRPDTLIYADLPGHPLSLVGFMFSVPRGLEAGSPGGPITRWHWHVVCANPKQRGRKPLPNGSCPPGTRLHGGSEMLHVWFTGDLRSAYAIHAPVPELCAAKLVPPAGCQPGRHEHGM